MTLTSSMAALLHVALQDLRSGKALLVERLPSIAAAVGDARLSALLAAETDRAVVARGRLGHAGGEGGPTNLWMAGILDDADRDATSHQAGMIRDVALIGAVRKAKAAEIVSLDTAIALADAQMADMLKALREEAIATDHQLRGLLEELTN
jgi:hypothetical protein